jgi:hypothetical protein
MLTGIIGARRAWTGLDDLGVGDAVDSARRARRQLVPAPRVDAEQSGAPSAPTACVVLGLPGRWLLRGDDQPEPEIEQDLGCEKDAREHEEDAHERR